MRTIMALNMLESCINKKPDEEIFYATFYAKGRLIKQYLVCQSAKEYISNQGGLIIATTNKEVTLPCTCLLAKKLIGHFPG